jgi:hypothetical protein
MPHRERGLFDPPPANTQPIANPVDRFAHLPEETREWLEQLRQDDIEEIRSAIRFMREVKTVGKFGKWALITVVSTFTGAVLLGEKIAIFWKFVTGAPK